MTTDEQLRQVFAAVRKVPDSFGNHSSIQTLETWDSLKQTVLMAALAEEVLIGIPGNVAAELTSFPALKGVVENPMREGVRG